MYVATTHDIEVRVKPYFMERESDPEERVFFWGYQVTIANNGAIGVTLRERYWKITDAHGRIEEVRGPGVVGEQPHIGPGDSYQYTSGCPLGTTSGFMQGHYVMESVSGELAVEIPVFSLDIPGDRRTAH